MKNVVLFGGGLHANVCIDIIEKTNEWNIVGIVDSLAAIGSDLYGYPVIGRQENLVELVAKYDISGGLISIGDNFSRKIVYDCLVSQIPDFHFINAVHPSAQIGRRVEIGKGVVIMAGCNINPDTLIADFCITLTGAQIEHNCRLNEFSSVSVGSILGGKVTIGAFSAVTLGVTILDRITIGSNTVVGAGSLVINDLPDNVLAYGNPAKIIRNRTFGERFLKSM